MTDQATPIFFLPPQVIPVPSAEHDLSTRKFQGIPSLAAAPSGRLWATWYAGPTPGEDENNYVVLSTSADAGKTWKECLYVDPDGPGPVRAFDPELWLDPDGTLWLFWAQAIGHDGSIAGVWAMTALEPEREDPAWSAPRRLTDGVMMCKPLVLSSGEWLLPASTWRKTDNSARAVVSTDKGKTWELRGGCNIPEEVRSYDEHMFIEKKDGRLWLLVRTQKGIGESFTEDAGRSWGSFNPAAIQHTSSRFFSRRLSSGNLLLIKHGPVAENVGRCQLMAFISEDDGGSWNRGLLLDERQGVSYPDGQQDSSGVINIIYDYSRTGEREILLARFTEADVMAGSPDSVTVNLRLTVSKGV